MRIRRGLQCVHNNIIVYVLYRLKADAVEEPLSDVCLQNIYSERFGPTHRHKPPQMR